MKFKERIDELRGKLADDYAKMLEREQEALVKLKESIENRLKSWGNPNAQLELNWTTTDKTITIDEPIAKAYLGEDEFIGEVSRFGHGMQRIFLVSLLHYQEIAFFFSQSL